jgi:hypothetical protein
MTPSTKKLEPPQIPVRFRRGKLPAFREIAALHHRMRLPELDPSFPIATAAVKALEDLGIVLSR